MRAETLRVMQGRKVAYAPAIVWSALLFATFHLTTGIASALHALCAGVWLAIWYLRYRSLFLIVTLHALYNGIVLLV